MHLVNKAGFPGRDRRRGRASGVFFSQPTVVEVVQRSTLGLVLGTKWKLRLSHGDSASGGAVIGWTGLYVLNPICFVELNFFDV
jgi:hypothetical protein